MNVAAAPRGGRSERKREWTVAHLFRGGGAMIGAAVTDHEDAKVRSRLAGETSRYTPQGYCPHCRYRMDPGVCPECGLAVSSEMLVYSRTGWTKLAWPAARVIGFSVLHFGLLMIAIFMALSAGLEPGDEGALIPPTSRVGDALTDALLIPERVVVYASGLGNRGIYAGIPGFALHVFNSLAFGIGLEAIWQGWSRMRRRRQLAPAYPETAATGGVWSSRLITNS